MRILCQVKIVTLLHLLTLPTLSNSDSWHFDSHRENFVKVPLLALEKQQVHVPF